MFWRFKNSLFMLIALFPPFTFVPFAIMAYKVRSIKWLLTSIVYMVAFYAIFFERTPLTILTFIFSWGLGNIHLLVVKNEYLAKLEKINNKQDTEATIVTTAEPSPVFTPNNDYLEQIKNLNALIKDENIADQLAEMEKICANIFYYTKKHPEKEAQIQDFLNYYLPETIGLLQNYYELSQHSIKTANIDKAMQEIVDALTVVINSFNNLYNNLFADKVLNISTDIKVLKDILQQNGLVKNKYDDILIRKNV